MNHSFIAYIDESGDDGLHDYREPSGRGGATTWLVISACVCRYQHYAEAPAWRDEILTKIGKKNGRELHFRNLNHQQKVVAAQYLASKKIRCINVMSNKLTIPVGTYTQKNQLYHYLTRYLIERVSWFCRDYRQFVPEGDGSVKIIFSRRGGMSYPDFQKYLHHLKEDPTVRVHWPVIDIDGVSALDHARCAALQLGDSIASAFASAVEPNFYGNCELQYAETLKPVTYRYNAKFLSYGVKLVPCPEMAMSEQQQKFVDLFTVR